MIEHKKLIEIFRTRTSVPKYLFQGPLFSVAKNNHSENIKERLLKTFAGQELLVAHEGFNQFDLAVSLAYKKIINQGNSFEDIKFTIANFSSALNRKDGGKTRKFIVEAFRKSNNFHLCFDFGRSHAFDGYRLNKFKEIGANQFQVSFNTDYLFMVYSEKDIFDIDIDLFLSLQLGLQSWLYGFMCSIPEQTKIDLDVLHEFSGSNYKSCSDFKKAIKEALNALYKKGIIEWRHGVTRDGIVFWKYKNPFIK